MEKWPGSTACAETLETLVTLHAIKILHGEAGVTNTKKNSSKQLSQMLSDLDEHYDENGACTAATPRDES
jgi:hypothetical protein